MKKILLFVAALACSVASWAQSDAVSATVANGELAVSLTNATSYVAFQMDIALPAGVTVDAENAVNLNSVRLNQPNGTVTIASSTESNNFKIAYNTLSNGHVRVIAYNLENREIQSNSGALFTVTLNGYTSGDITLSQVKFVTKGQLEEQPLADATAEAGDVDPEVLYDLNEDGSPDIDDAMLIIDAWLEGTDADHPEWDLNGDDAVDIDDAMLIIDYWLNA